MSSKSRTRSSKDKIFLVKASAEEIRATLNISPAEARRAKRIVAQFDKRHPPANEPVRVRKAK
jgi:hypothetical protein